MRKPGKVTAATMVRRIADASWTGFLDDLGQRWRDPEPHRKQDRSRRRQREILQAALRIFARDGIARARIADIAAEGGMPVSSIYEYFSGKEELAYAVPLAQLGAFFMEYGEQARHVAGARQRLRLYLCLTTDFARRNPEWARTLYLEIWPSVLVAEARVRAALDEFAVIIMHLIASGEAAGEWVGGDNRYETAAILVGSVNQLIITWLMYQRPRDIGSAAASMVDRLLSCLLPALPSKAEQHVQTRIPRRLRPRVSGSAARPTTVNASGREPDKPNDLR